MEQESCRRNHGGASWLRQHGGGHPGITGRHKGGTRRHQEAPRRHSGGIQEALRRDQKALGRQPGGKHEAPKRHPRSAQGPQDSIGLWWTGMPTSLSHNAKTQLFFNLMKGLKKLYCLFNLPKGC